MRSPQGLTEQQTDRTRIDVSLLTRPLRRSKFLLFCSLHVSYVRCHDSCRISYAWQRCFPASQEPRTVVSCQTLWPNSVTCRMRRRPKFHNPDPPSIPSVCRAAEVGRFHSRTNSLFWPFTVGRSSRVLCIALTDILFHQPYIVQPY